ncbi:hypothetical protein [Altibacter lentus]|uniref:hypothetical protein n=1 Tax=Altibacter lentus TaxID=1223410 RepID=UPI0005590266|nr:hypothetical protein [Altibacter lentus]
MKKTIIALTLLISMTMIAQTPDTDKKEMRKEMRQKMKDLTPEQAADLQTKKLTLALDLSEAQQKEIKSLALEEAIKRKARSADRKDRTEMTTTELYEHKAMMMEEKIAYKVKMKKILTEPQYEKWEKMSANRGRGLKKHAKKKGDSKNK